MANSMDEIMHPGSAGAKDPEFPHAPSGWSRDAARATAAEEGLELTEDHWETVRALQEYYDRHEAPGDINLRELHDALEEHFHAKGGIKYLYTLFPGGPVAQGCRLAGLQAPPQATDKSFGSVG